MPAGPLPPGDQPDRAAGGAHHQGQGGAGHSAHHGRGLTMTPQPVAARSHPGPPGGPGRHGRPTRGRGASNRLGRRWPWSGCLWRARGEALGHERRRASRLGCPGPVRHQRGRRVRGRLSRRLSARRGQRLSARRGHGNQAGGRIPGGGRTAPRRALRRSSAGRLTAGHAGGAEGAGRAQSGPAGGARGARPQAPPADGHHARAHQEGQQDEDPRRNRARGRGRSDGRPLDPGAPRRSPTVVPAANPESLDRRLVSRPRRRRKCLSSGKEGQGARL